MVHPDRNWRCTSGKARILLRCCLGSRLLLLQLVKTHPPMPLFYWGLIGNSYVYGGISPNETALGDLHILSLPSFEWISVSGLSPFENGQC